MAGTTALLECRTDPSFLFLLLLLLLLLVVVISFQLGSSIRVAPVWRPRAPSGRHCVRACLHVSLEAVARRMRMVHQLMSLCIHLLLLFLLLLVVPLSVTFPACRHLSAPLV